MNTELEDQQAYLAKTLIDNNESLLKQVKIVTVHKIKGDCESVVVTEMKSVYGFLCNISFSILST